LIDNKLLTVHKNTSIDALRKKRSAHPTCCP